MATSGKQWTAVGMILIAAVMVSGCPTPGGGGYLVYPLSLDFSGTKDQMTVNVTNYCAANGPWTATSNVPWLTVTPDTGAGEYTQVTVTVTRPETKAMDLGKNTANIQFVFTGGVQDVPVTAWVWPETTFETWYDEGSDFFPFKQEGTLSLEYLNDVEVCPDGGYVGVGYIDQVSGSIIEQKNVVYGDAYVVKTDVYGNKEWSINWGTDGWDEAMAVVAADDGSYIVAGWQVVGIDFLDKSLDRGTYAQLTKISPQGVIEWQKMYGDGTYWAWGVQKTADGGYIIAGDNFRATDVDVYSPFLIKTDADGNVEWSKLYDAADYDRFVYGVDVAADGGYIVVGESYPYGLPSKASKTTKHTDNEDKQGGEVDLFLMKTDPSGNVQWANDYGTESGVDYGRDVVVLPGQGGYAACGASDSYAVGRHTYLVKVDISGEQEWDEYYDFSTGSQANGIVRDEDGNYILAGWSEDINARKQLEEVQAYLLKVDADGVPDWVDFYGDEWYEYFDGLRIAPDGGYIAAGGSEYYDFILDSDAYLVKTDEDGYID